MTVLVTGANRGIGKAFVERLASGGVKHVYAGARDLTSLAGLLTELPGTVTPLRIDITDPQSVADAAARATDVNVLVNNAGILRGGGVTSRETFDGAREEMEANYFGLLTMSRAFAPALIANAPSAIVNVLSILGLIGIPRAATYSASKAAALSATRAIRAELSPEGVRVIGVMPGFVDTDMVANLPGEKISPQTVVDAALEAISSGNEDVYPGARAAHLAQAFFSDYKSLEKSLAG